MLFVCGGKGGGAEGGGKRSLRIFRLFVLCCKFIAVFFSLQLMWVQLVIESADFHPDTHARDSERTHTHTVGPRFCSFYWIKRSLF